MRVNIVLIDAENVKPEAIGKLKPDQFKVFVFVGANQKRLDVESVMALQAMGANGAFVQISGNGPNALDFHIAYYIGRLATEHPEAYFHIISKDTGFDPLIDHLKNQKVFCDRFACISEIPPVRVAEKVTPKDRAADFHAKRIAKCAARPATVKTLQSSIESHFFKQLSPEEVSHVVETLKTSGRIVVNGTKVAYPDSAAVAG